MGGCGREGETIISPPLVEKEQLVDCASKETPVLSLSKPIARPGEYLTFLICYSAFEIERGMDSYLEHWNGKQWITTHLLVSGEVDSGFIPSYSSYPSAGELPAIAFIDAGPEWVRLPDNIDPGTYRIKKEFIAYMLEDDPGKVSEKITAYGEVRVIPKQ